MFLKRCVFSSVLIMALAAAGLLMYAEERPAEATARVPELETFHEVIYKIWHEAWPKKDTAMLRQVLPEVENGISTLASAKLPGILRDKKGAWEEGIKKLQAVGNDYRHAADSKDDPRLLDAAEKLHSQFESLVRIIRPALKELDEFHAVLYMLYHHDLPKYNIQSIRSATAALKEKIAVLNSASLPARFKQKEAEFQTARTRLSASVDALESIVKSNDEQKIRNGVDAVHSNYQALERIF